MLGVINDSNNAPKPIIDLFLSILEIIELLKIMELNEFIENFAEQFDDTDASEIKADTVFKELDEWSSLVALSVIAMVDEEYDITIKGDEIWNSNTVEDLFNAIKAKA